MIENLQDSIILAGGIVILCALVLGVVLGAMFVYFEIESWLSAVRKKYWTRRS